MALLGVDGRFLLDNPTTTNISRSVISICVGKRNRHWFQYWPDCVNYQKHCLKHYWLYMSTKRCGTIANLRVAHEPGMPGTLSPPPRVSDADMHHGTCVTHVPWCMPGSLTSGVFFKSVAENNVPGIPGACTTRNFTYLVRGRWRIYVGGDNYDVKATALAPT